MLSKEEQMLLNLFSDDNESQRLKHSSPLDDSKTSQKLKSDHKIEQSIYTEPPSELFFKGNQTIEAEAKINE